MAHPDANSGWTLHLDSERVKDGADVVDRWWQGEGDLEIDGHTWRGAEYPDGKGALISVQGVQFTQSVPGRRATIRIAVTSDAVRRLLQVDLGAVQVTLGFVYRDAAGAWQRVPRSFSGRIGRSGVSNGVFEAEVETYLGDVDRGIPEYWSHETAPPGDLYAEQARELEEGLDTRWPPFVVDPPKPPKRKGRY